MPFYDHAGKNVAALALTLAFSICLLAAADDALLAAEAPSYYQDKVVRIVVGTAPGGGFDVYARAIARHWGKHIPGYPQLIIENQPGAATLLAVLQTSFMETMKDAEFLADAKKSSLEINPTSGEDTGKAINRLFQLEPSMVARMKSILLGD